MAIVQRPHAPLPVRDGEAPSPLTGALSGRRIAILESRYPQQLSALIGRYGGIPHAVPSLREVDAVDQAALLELLESLDRFSLAVAIFQTGVGTAALLRATASLGAVAEMRFRHALSRATVVARGPKPLAVLGGAGVRVDRVVPSPHTTNELLAVLTALDLAGQHVLVQHHGGPNMPLVEFLQSRGAVLHELVLYRWALPDDLRPLLQLLDDLRDGQIDALLVTSAAQVHHLCAVAERNGRLPELRESLAQRTVVGAVGPVCAATLAEHGIQPARLIQPSTPKMAPLVAALATHFANQTPPPLPPDAGADNTDRSD